MKKYKKIISWFLVILWVLIIFLLSSMTTTESNAKSKGTINKVIDKTIEVTNGAGITNKHPSEYKMNSVVDMLNLPLRKCMHATEYFILALLLLNALRASEGHIHRAIIISILGCFLYACTDEFHQLFVDGRTGQFSDVLIDTAGAVVGCIIWIIVKNIKDKVITNKLTQPKNRGKYEF